ncbi:FixH family protein [Aquamicrobium segne]|uniref:FixH family protein n=1 Tax=Aquamicrobium segne TaxID=469547 RepID=A0ABW0H0F0_9HYPH
MTQQFTGRHFLLIMIAFFSVIITVNLAMAYFAYSSWTGFVVRNAHIAGLEFNRKSREHQDQVALGWQTTLEGADGIFRFALTDAEGRPVELKSGMAIFRRPIGDTQDTMIALTPVPNGALDAPFALGDGIWNVEIEADAGRDVPWHEIHRITVKNGVIK